MKENFIKFITVNFGLTVMWVAGSFICYKILDRPSGWALIPVVLIMVIVGAITNSALSPSSDAKKKNG